MRAAHSEARLVAERVASEAGSELRLALVLKPDPGWHVYWKNAGDSGEAPILNWRSRGLEVGPPVYPVPSRLPVGPLMNYGYAGETPLLLPARVSPEARGEARGELDAEWLVCKVECVPARGRLSARVAVGQAKPEPSWAAVESLAAGRFPRRSEGLRARAEGSAAGHRLSVALPPGEAVPPSAYFFSEEPLVVDHAAEQRFTAKPGGFELALPAAPEAAGAPQRLRGVLALEGGPGYSVDVPVGIGGAGLAGALGLAFLGGLLLNLMPCVLPVLSIKVLGFLEEGGRGAKARGLAYSAGVLVSFWLIAGVLLLLRAQGQKIGWGFQLQSPAVSGALAALFAALALNLLGFFELGGRLTRLGGLVSGAGGLRGSFASGALAVVVATPCTAPFMGAALGAALALPPAAAFLIFTALGAGMSLPYAAFAAFPAGLRLLPRPGPWMTTLKRWLALPLLATSAWLLWVLGLQLGGSKAASALPWEPYSEAALERHLERGSDVFVDFTAAWCVTCQVNERFVLERGEARRALERPGLALLKADWTSRDAAITEALERLGRDGVPVYAFYSSGRPPVLLPTVLTPAAVVEAVSSKK
ncbi:MAG: thioredoxin family protein [Elusimicrobia bacterium]|nr:thioredoxin family protein [Elusimicrobiota bacterium]